MYLFFTELVIDNLSKPAIIGNLRIRQKATSHYQYLLQYNTYYSNTIEYVFKLTAIIFINYTPTR